MEPLAIQHFDIFTYFKLIRDRNPGGTRAEEGRLCWGCSGVGALLHTGQPPSGMEEELSPGDVEVSSNLPALMRDRVREGRNKSIP